MSADGQKLFIAEVGGDGRTITLENSTLPQQGLSEGSTLRTATSWYPGASASSVQVLGTQEDDMVFEGRLSDTIIGRIGAAEELRADLRSLFYGQRLLRIEWGTVLVKKAYLKRPVFRHIRDSVLEYALTFEIAEADDQEVVVADRQVALISDSTLLGELSDLVSAAEDVLADATAINNVVRAVT